MSDRIVAMLELIAWGVIIIGCLMGGVDILNDLGNRGTIIILSSIISGVMFLGFAQVITTLCEISNKLSAIKDKDL